MNNVLIGIKRNAKIYISYIAALALYCFTVFLMPGFGVGSHFTVLANQMALIGIMSIGQTFVIMTGGIDLSVPWLINSTAILLVVFYEISGSLAISIILVLLYSSFVGLMNGIGVSILGIPSIIMTLGVNSILQGAMLGILRGSSGGAVPVAFERICNFKIGNIPMLLIIWLLFSLATIMVMHFTSYGRKLIIVGSNPIVAKFSGIRSALIIIVAYIVAGVSSGLGGILLAGRLGQTYLGMGEPYMYMTLSAVVLGGTSMSGGSGSYIGTISGTILVVLLSGFLSAIKLPTSAQNIFYGVILFIATIMLSGDNLLKKSK